MILLVVIATAFLGLGKKIYMWLGLHI